MELYIALIVSIIALAFAFWRASWVKRQPAGEPNMQEIAGYIEEGALAFLRAEYKVLAIFSAVVAIALTTIYVATAPSNLSEMTGGAFSSGIMGLVGVAFILGAVCSGGAGFAGMRVATKANVRTANAARTGLAKALDVSFSGGVVMGLSVVGLGLLGVTSLLLIVPAIVGIDFSTAFTAEGSPYDTVNITQLLMILTGFLLGTSTTSLFARVGGGIYTKAADVGADLVGKVEAGIPEDDPRNPATIADNVGDNVGDVAGMGADLFESFVGAIVSAMVLGIVWAEAAGNAGPLMLPVSIASLGIIVSILATFVVRISEDGNPAKALHTGAVGAGLVTAAGTYVLVTMMIPDAGVTIGDSSYSQLGVFFATVVGLAAGNGIGFVTEYYTSDQFKPVHEVAKESQMGSGPNIIAGLGLGMQSTAIPVLLICVAIIVAYNFAGLYGIALAALGMVATIAVQIAVDGFGPIADNAGGIAEMSHLPPEVRERTDKLDSVGNTTAAIGKGFSIGTAALTALALFTAFAQQVNLTEINILDPYVMVGVFIGAIMPFVFSSMAMKAVGRSAGAMIEEVRRQFREIDGLLEGTAKADYATCVEISTKAALREMLAPGLLAIIVPTLAGFSGIIVGEPSIGPRILGGLLAGVTTSGVAMAIFMANAGGAWDNAKKFIEAGNFGGKGSEAHKAAVNGDTVGDPFKDTAGPSLNLLLKLMTTVALVLAPVIAIEATASATEDAASASVSATVDTELDNSGQELAKGAPAEVAANAN